MASAMSCGSGSMTDIALLSSCMTSRIVVSKWWVAMESVGVMGRRGEE